MKGVTVIRHPVVAHWLTRLRDRRTAPGEFRRLIHDLTSLVVFEATRNLSTRGLTVTTPLSPFRGVRLARQVTLVPVLRAGLGMLEPALNLIPGARAGFLRASRDELTLRATAQLPALPRDLHNDDVILLDPMLATGGTAVLAIDLLKGRGARRLRTVHLVAAPEGLRRVRKEHPDTGVYVAAVDRGLDRRGYIVPGLGDAGDRLFGA